MFVKNKKLNCEIYVYIEWGLLYKFILFVLIEFDGFKITSVIEQFVCEKNNILYLELMNRILVYMFVVNPFHTIVMAY